jgi:TPP-dependent pyruvate/acetoin dehydrogenase alpha subunit
MSNIKSFYEKMFLIRAFEERLLELFSQGKINGTTHTYSGQEAIGVSAIHNLIDSDIIFSNHRCHGHFLARFDDPKSLLAELMGKMGGVCDGRGGSQHLCHDTFYTNGIQGGFLPIAVGSAYAKKHCNKEGIVVAFIGDGTFGEGIVYESLNLASLWRVPLLIVVENNRYAQSTPISSNMAGNIYDRVAAFGIDVGQIESNDVTELDRVFSRAISKVRTEQQPFVQIVDTYRLGPHSKGDDFRPKEEIENWFDKDPLKIAEKYIGSKDIEKIERSVLDRLEIIEEEVLILKSVQLAGVEADHV